MPSADKPIQLLERFQQQKQDFVFPLEPQSVELFLTGFRAACASCGLDVPRKLKQQVLERRGWKYTASGPTLQMRDKGMKDEAIMDELIRIEIEQLRMIGDKTPASKAPAAAPPATPSAVPAAPAPKAGKWWWPGSGG